MSQPTTRELAYQRERSLLESVTRATDVMLALLDPDFDFVWVNHAYAATCQLTPEEIVGKNHFELYPHPENEEIFRRVRDTGEAAFYHDKPFVFPDQPERGVTYWDWSLVPVVGDDGRPTGLVLSLRETTAFKEAREELERTEKALRESDGRLRLALEAAYAISFDWDIERNEVHRFVSFEPALGPTDGDRPATFEDVCEVVHPEDRELFTSSVRAALEREDGRYQSEFRVLRPDGEVVWLSERGRVARDEEGRPVRLIGLSQDVTDRKSIEQQLRESLTEKEILLREIHHRVKNNLQVVASLVSLQASALDDPKLREALGEVRNRVLSMGLIHDALHRSGSFARLDFDRYCAGLLESLVRVYGPMAERVKLELELEPVVLSVASAVPCGLILNELATNALRHAFPNGEGELTVRLSLEPASKRVCLCVRDNGRGLPEGLDWRRCQTLGLRLVQMLARQLEGTVETGPGPGAEFRVSFVDDELERLRAPQGESTSS